MLSRLLLLLTFVFLIWPSFHLDAKTYVRPYTRSDGTQVRGHYRSSPSQHSSGYSSYGNSGTYNSDKHYDYGDNGGGSSIKNCIDPKSGKKYYSNQDCSSAQQYIHIPPIKSEQNKEQVKKKTPLTPVVSSIDHKIGEYFRKANENVGALNCSTPKYIRFVPQPTKNEVRARDGNRCVICGSTSNLEIDHKRALMNGGANGVNNLATLCDDCHTKKTRMDTSLRKKRERNCKNKLGTKF